MRGWYEPGISIMKTVISGAGGEMDPGLGPGPEISVR